MYNRVIFNRTADYVSVLLAVYVAALVVCVKYSRFIVIVFIFLIYLRIAENLNGGWCAAWPTAEYYIFFCKFMKFLILQNCSKVMQAIFAKVAYFITFHIKA